MVHEKLLSVVDLVFGPCVSITFERFLVPLGLLCGQSEREKNSSCLIPSNLATVLKYCNYACTFHRTGLYTSQSQSNKQREEE